MRIAYVDCHSGVSGDMLLGALIGAGIKPEELKKRLLTLGVRFDLEVKSVFKKGIRAIKVDVLSEEEGHVHRKLGDIKRMITGSDLPEEVKRKAIFIFELIAEAEAEVHGLSMEEIHFHEVGAVDSIVDVVGTVLGFYILGIDKVISSPINVGRGYVATAHGLLPIPAPATSILLEGIPIYSDGTKGELATPTGVAVLKVLSECFSDMPSIRLEKVSFGAGSMDLPIPNVLRLFIGELDDWMGEIDEVILLESDIDDSSPEILGSAAEELLERGALDVSLVPIYMKKNRPGIRLSVLAREEKLWEILKSIFLLTTTLGIRFQRVRRYKLSRETLEIDVGMGKVRVKLGRMGSRLLNLAPEFEDCKKLSEERGIPLKFVYKLVWEKLGERIKKEVLESG
ncbi:MAG: nickel pincer cofactor biosynthesis protein LarC [Synergistetes bacterium]|nr:nickel pincer cofactor biosynthesis protein LarC [Synergistota bacterium]